MPKVRLTENSIRTIPLPANKLEHLIADSETAGLKLRLRRGSDGETLRSFVFQFSRSGQKNKSPKLTLGRVGGIALAQARQLCREHNGALARGEDPVVEKATAKIRQAETFGALLPQYLKFSQSRLRPKSLNAVRRHLEDYAAPLHGLPLERVTRRDVATLKAAIAESSGRVSSNRMRSSLGGFFRWCMQEGLLEASPVLNTTVEPEQPRTRVLAPNELALIWTHLEEGSDYCAIIRLLMLLGSRASEIGGLRWSEITGDLVSLPPARVKTDTAHLIPLPPVALDIIERVPRRKNPDGSPRDFVFGTGSTGYNGWHKSKQQLDERIAKANGGRALAPWVVHDLRRSFCSHANEIGIEPHIIEQCMGHKVQGIAGRYNYAVYLNQRRAAIQRWSDLLMTWIEGRPGSNVVALARPA
jgi:integrase